MLADAVLIPWQRLDPETLKNLLEEYVSREGTDYGQQEFSLAQKVRHVQQQMQRGELVLVWDHETETCNFMLKQQYQQVFSSKGNDDE